jgi:hypothetical protein
MEILLIIVFLTWCVAAFCVDQIEERGEKTKKTIIDYLRRRKEVRRNFLVEKITGLLKNCEQAVDWEYHINTIINEMIKNNEISVTQSNGFELLSLNKTEKGLSISG